MNGPSPTRTRSAACAGPLPDNTSIASIGAANVRSLIVFIFTLLQERLASISFERTHRRAACSTSPRRGEVGSQSDPGEGGPIEGHLPPHPIPLPAGEREQAEYAAGTCTEFEGSCSIGRHERSMARPCGRSTAAI